MAFEIVDKQPHRHELSEDRAPFRRRKVLADAIGGEVVMAELPDALPLAAAQHVDDVPGAKALARAINARERLLRQLRAVKALGRLEAAVAIAARLCKRLPEIGEQNLPAAARALAIADQGFKLAPLDLLLPVRRIRCLDQLTQLRHILEAVEHEGLRRQAVAPGAARFLVISLEALRQIEMR